MHALTFSVLREEKGYGDDEVDLKIVHLGTQSAFYPSRVNDGLPLYLEKGENYSLSFLRLNPNGE